MCTDGSAAASRLGVGKARYSDVRLLLLPMRKPCSRSGTASHDSGGTLAGSLIACLLVIEG